MPASEPKKSSADLTRQKLIAAATDVFAELGYRAATVREIVRRAAVNQAAINYHFRGKDELYREVIRQAYEDVTPAEDGAPMAASPEAQVLFLIKELLAPGKSAPYAALKFHKLLAWELVEPSGTLDSFGREGPLRHHAMVMGMVRQLLPRGAPDHEVAWAAFWLIGQCTMVRQAENIIKLMPPPLAKAIRDNEGKLPEYLAGLALLGLKGSGAA